MKASEREHEVWKRKVIDVKTRNKKIYIKRN
jgi:hypothetical protein